MVNRRSLLKGSVLTLAGCATTKIAAAGVEVEPSGDSAPFTSILPGIWKATIGTPESYTPVSARAFAPAARAIQQLPEVRQVPIDSLSGKADPRGCLLTLPLDPHEEIFGFGLQLLSFAQRGKKKTIRVNADPKVDTGDSHAPTPFYLSTRGYGVLVDTCRYASFYCGDARLKPASPGVAAKSAGSARPNSAHNLAKVEPERILVDVPRATGVDVYVFAGPTMLDAMRRYNLFSGGGVEPPEWGLGLWYRAVGTANAIEALAIARNLRDSKIPCDVLGLEPGWQSHAYSCSFSWNSAHFPNPAEFIKDVTTLGYRINLWEHAFVHPTSPLFEPLLPHSGDYGVWGGLVPDFAGTPARQIFGEYHGKNFIELGISGFKLDECDNSDFTKGWSFPEFCRFPSGIDGEQMHSVFGLRYQDAILDQFKSRGKETYNLVRSSGALAAPYPFVLYSDLYGHRDFVRALVNSGFSGLLWCPEVRDATSPEDLVRRLQTVVFSPLAMVNAWYIKNPPWDQVNRDKNNQDELMSDRATVSETVRNLLQIRMSFIPYLYSAFNEYHATGKPPVRALVLDWPNDARVREIDDEFMFGDSILVAPIFADQTNRSVYLPAGDWYDFWTHAKIQGGKSMKVANGVTQIPLFVKSGTLLPLAEPVEFTKPDTCFNITVNIVGSQPSNFTLYEDDGLTTAYDKGGQNRVTLHAEGDQHSVQRTGNYHGPERFKIVDWKSF